MMSTLDESFDWSIYKRCITCGAKTGQPCTDQRRGHSPVGIPVTRPHDSRPWMLHPCTCKGCWACIGHTPGCTCDVDFRADLYGPPAGHPLTE